MGFTYQGRHPLLQLCQTNGQPTPPRCRRQPISFPVLSDLRTQVPLTVRQRRWPRRSRGARPLQQETPHIGREGGGDLDLQRRDIGAGEWLTAMHNSEDLCPLLHRWQGGALPRAQTWWCRKQAKQGSVLTTYLNTRTRATHGSGDKLTDGWWWWWWCCYLNKSTCRQTES